MVSHINLPFYLPIAAETVSAMAGDGAPEAFVDSAPVHELVAALLIQNFPAFVQRNISAYKIETMYASALTVAHGAGAGASSFREQFRIRFDPAAVLAGAACMQQLKVIPLEADALAAQDFLLVDGVWDIHFCARHYERLQPLKRTMTLPGGRELKVGDQQGRMLDEFRACNEESMVVQGMAGVGKTFLISKLYEMLNPSTTLLLAYMPSQVDALKARLADSRQEPHAMTFGAMANTILNADRSAHSWIITDRQRGQSNYLVQDHVVAQWLNFQSVAGLRVSEVASLCRRAMFSYCMSTSNEVEAKHLPATGARLSVLDVSVLLEYVRRMWRETVSPSSPEIRLPIRQWQRIKWLSLTELSLADLPEQFTHIMIDESHEVSQPLAAILDRSPQSILSLGDEHQHLNGLASRRRVDVRQRCITQSLRAGKAMESVLNPIIEVHPARIQEGYEGCAAHRTEIQRYRQMDIPDKPTTVLVENEWGLLLWLKKMADRDAPFQMAERTAKDLVGFITDLIELYNGGARPRHRLIFRYGTWDALAATMGRSHAFLAAQEMLDRGLNYRELELLFARLNVPGAAVTLSPVTGVKNMEFNRVLVSQDLMRPPRKTGSHSLAHVASLLYTASSRARRELLVPQDMIGWVEALKAHA